MARSLARSFKTAAWLGWQVESNWTDPLLFFAFSALKPIAAVMILVFMYRTVAQTSTDDPIYAYIYLGNAFYIYVGTVMAGASYAILDDREHYRTLKYLYVAPISIPVYLVGRAVARFLVGSLAVLITLLAGVLFFELPIDPRTVDWPLLLGALGLGLVSLTLMGIILGLWTLTLRVEPWAVGESFAAALYLFSGAIFPIALLPAWLQPLGLALPVTYWLELVRRAMLGGQARGFPPLDTWSSGQILAMLAGITLALLALCWIAYRGFDRLARERGMLEAQSNF